MGHSAGAHLVALLSADPGIGNARAVTPWLGSVCLDSGAYDVVAIMSRQHLPLYDKAFGSDPEAWLAASPMQQLKARPVAPMLLVCSARRPAGVAQAEAFAARCRSFGGRAVVLPVDLSHQETNELAGVAGGYTDSIDDFLRSVGVP